MKVNANFTSIQSKHIVPMVGQDVLPVRSGYSAVLPQLMPDKFCVTADEDGVVSKVTDTKIFVKYKDLGEKAYSLSPWFGKVEGGVTYRHTITTPLVKGSKFKAGYVICYAETFFDIDFFDPNRVVYKNGKIIRTSFLEDSDTFEDSIALHDSVSPSMGSDTTNIKQINIPADFRIVKPVKIGTKLTHNDIIMLMQNKVEDEQTLGEQLELDEDTLAILSELNDNAPKANIVGVVKDIVCRYNVPLSELTNSVRTFVKESEARLVKKDGEGASGLVNVGFNINGKALDVGSVDVRYYIEKRTVAVVGDKYVFGNQLKGTISTILPDQYDENGNIIEAEFSTISEAARIVNSSDLVGVKTTILYETSKIAGNL